MTLVFFGGGGVVMNTPYTLQPYLLHIQRNVKILWTFSSEKCRYFTLPSFYIKNLEFFTNQISLLRNLTSGPSYSIVHILSPNFTFWSHQAHSGLCTFALTYYLVRKPNSLSVLSFLLFRIKSSMSHTLRHKALRSLPGSWQERYTKWECQMQGKCVSYILIPVNI